MTIEDMEDLLHDLGIETYGTRGSEVRGLCPGHVERTGKQDHNPSWSINSDTGAHYCFSCQFKGSLPFLVSYVKGIPMESATDYMQDPANDLSGRLARALAPKIQKEEEVIDITEANLAAYVEPNEHMLRGRGLTPLAASAYGVLWDKRKDSWILPIRDHNEKLMGWQEKGVTGRYFKNYPTGIKKSQSLFGYHVYKGGPMIVVESPLDTLRLYSVGITGGVSTYGTAVSKDQLNMIKGADSVVFAMDHDDAGLIASKELLYKAKEMGIVSSFFDYSGIEVKDIGGMSKAEILQGLTNARHSIYGEKAFQ